MAQRFAEPMARLIDELRKLPGVGTKSAQRFAFHVLRASDADAEALASAIRSLRQHLRLCSVCNNITDVDPCAYCTSATRDAQVLCVVEEPTNIAGIEKTRSFNGVYHVLHGTLSPVNGVGPEQLRLRNLWARLEHATEVILAMSPTVEGEATARYVLDEVRRMQPALRVSRIATGVPAGSDIEYADEVTMTRALEGTTGPVGPPLPPPRTFGLKSRVHWGYGGAVRRKLLIPGVSRTKVSGMRGLPPLVSRVAADLEI